MKSLRTSLRLLMEFAGSEARLGVGDLAERCKLSKGQVSKILAAFAEAGLLDQDPKSRKFSVGMRAFALGSRFVNYDPLTREAMPIMRELVERSGHSTRLSVMDGDFMLYLLGIEGPLFIDTGWRAGTWLPWHSTSAGRVMLAFLDQKRAEELLNKQPLPKLTANTVTDKEAIRRMMVQIRNKGFATQRAETTPGLGTIGVPVMGPGNRCIAVLNLAFPVHVLPVKQEPALVDLLHQSARTLSMRMGCVVYPYGGTVRAMATAATAGSPRQS